MSRFSLSTVVLLLATMVPLAAQQGAPARPGPTPTIDDRTRAVVISHVDFKSGYRNELAAIEVLAH